MRNVANTHGTDLATMITQPPEAHISREFCSE